MEAWQKGQAHIRLVVQDEVSEAGARHLLCENGVVRASKLMVAPLLHQQNIDVDQQPANVFEDLVQLPIAAPILQLSTSWGGCWDWQCFFD